MRNKISIVIVGSGDIRSKSLRDFIEENRNHLNINHVYFDGYKASIKNYFDFQKNFFHQSSSLLTPGEYGCLMSHIMAYDICKELGHPTLILEDDAEPRDFVSLDFLHSIIDCCESSSAIHLGVQNGLGTHFSTKIKSLWSLPRGFPIWRTAAYVIGPTAAYSLLEFQRQHTRRADEWNVFTDARILNLKYIDCFDHPVEKGQQMESDRNGTSLNLRLQIKRAIDRRIQRLTRLKKSQPKLIGQMPLNY